VPITKELRALAPWWLASVFVIAADAYAGHYRVIPIGLLTFVTGTLALGAQSIGHEYSNRTLDALLALPCDRRRLFAAKLIVLLALVLTLGLIAWLCLTTGALALRAPSEALTLFVLPPLLAVTLAPWLTMMTQSTVAGVVFTAAVPGLLWTLLNVAAVAFEADYGSVWVRRGWVGGVLALCAAGAVLGWQRFRHLQAVDARGIEIIMPRSGRVSRARWRHPFWMLFQKELRLQQLTFAVALMYVTGWAGFALGTRVAGGWDAGISTVLNLLYFTILSLLIGSLASAQERQFGTADAQMVLPVGAWKQWAVKSGTAIAIALALGLGVPVLLDRLAPAYDTVRLFHGGTLMMASIIAVLTASSLYVSSLCRSGIAAMVFSFPALVAALFIVQTVGWTAALAASGNDLQPLIHGPFMQRTLETFVFCGMVLLLWLAGRNQRFADGDRPRIWRQALLIAAYLSTAGVVLGVLSGL
jgi:ABC-type transport system involved in multi-copper enzyme maturation permease subunit